MNRDQQKAMFAKLARGKRNVEIKGGDITIFDKNRNEVVKFVEPEYVEDPTIIPSIKNAIKLSDNPEKIKELIRRKP